MRPKVLKGIPHGPWAHCPSDLRRITRGSFGLSPESRTQGAAKVRPECLAKGASRSHGRFAGLREGASGRFANGMAGPLHPSGLEAGGADVEPARSPVHQGADLLDVGVPPAWRTAMRVGDLHPESGLLPADIADGCHGQGMVAAVICTAQEVPGQEACGARLARR